jgi:GNAT superfamily N-acetyltransferase
MSELEFHPLTPERWDDFETVFGKNGACAGCWCMWWRESRADYKRLAYEGNRLAMKALVESGLVPGLLAYVDGKPAAWCSLGPRESFPSLERSRVLARVDALPVWSIVCFFTARPYRRKGLNSALIDAALAYAAGQGAQVVEAYPIDKPGKFSGIEDFTGIASTFRRAGFVEVARRSPTRPLMRRSVGGAGTGQ